MTPSYACARLFGPALLSRLEALNAHPDLVRAIHLATELDDLADLVPDALNSPIAEIEACLLRVLSALSPAPTAGAK
ncbi:DUF3969 family protein [Myxococcus vastator]|uniref:DUF3969 family protein n=1 Tax=Myxococcus vastator TaxID=2709664 RepID=UPI001F074AFF|nr:DUF3969 family protein [Myxococcus vastator]